MCAAGLGFQQQRRAHAVTGMLLLLRGTGLTCMLKGLYFDVKRRSFWFETSAFIYLLLSYCID